jgi:hypothetical protein
MTNQSPHTDALVVVFLVVVVLVAMLASHDLVHELARDIAAVADASASPPCVEYTTALTSTVDVLLARLDECERAVNRAHADADASREELSEALVKTIDSCNKDYAFVDSIEDALVSIERALASLERELSACEGARAGEAREKAYEAVRASMSGVFGKVSAITETWSLARAVSGGGGEGGGAQPASPTSPKEYYFGDDDEGDKDATTASVPMSGMLTAKASALTEGARGFVGSLGERFNRLRTSSSANVAATDSEEKIPAAEPSTP